MNIPYTLPKVPYAYDAITLRRLYESPLISDFTHEGVVSSESLSVYGELRFPEALECRSYTCGCLVTSVDGKIAYNDDPAGPVIARSNALDPEGATADFWVLNLFRANMDAVIAGAGTLHKEPDGVICVMDTTLEEARVHRGMPRAPWVVIATLDGTDLPFDDKLLVNQPAMLHSSPAAHGLIEQKLAHDHFYLGPYRDSTAVWEDADSIRKTFDRYSDHAMPVILTGSDSIPDELALLAVLKVVGMDRTLIESPSYCHALMKKGLLDEFILNQSGVIVGGNALSIGGHGEAFTSTDHPHTQALTLHMHSPSFFYFRYSLRYSSSII
jgi:riboflavin biosynthesis pyrimidine reductase